MTVVLSPRALATARIPDHIDELLEHCLELGGSDLHLAAGAPPTVRVNGLLVPITGYDDLRGDVIEHLVFSILSDSKIAAFTNELELDSS